MGFAAHSRHTRPSKLPWLTDTRQTEPTGPQQPLGQRGFHPAASFNLSSRAAAASPRLSSCDRGWWQLQARLRWPCTQSWASPLRPSRGCRLPTEKPCHGWHHPSLSAAPETPGRQRRFPGRHGRQQFHMPHMLYLSEALFLALRCIYSSCNTLWCNIQHAFKAHFSIYCQVKC